MNLKNKIILESLASDLKRVALGLHRGSSAMAQRFLEEAILRKSEVKMSSVAPYIRILLSKISREIDKEDALMYSTLIQNYVVCKK